MSFRCGLHRDGGREVNVRNDGERKGRSSGAIRVLPPLFPLANIHREWRFLKEKVRGGRMKARYASRRTLSFKKAALGLDAGTLQTHFSTAPWFSGTSGSLPTRQLVRALRR